MKLVRMTQPPIKVTPTTALHITHMTPNPRLPYPPTQTYPSCHHPLIFLISQYYLLVFWRFAHTFVEARASVDSELEAMTPAEREAYLKEFEEAEKTGEPKKGSLIDKLIARGNKKTEEEIERQAKERQAARAGKDGVIR